MELTWRRLWEPVPSGVDIGIAIGMTALLQGELWFGEQYQGAPAFPGGRAANASFLLVIGVAVAWRRAKPLAAFLVVMAALAAASLTVGGSEAGGLFLVVLVMSYSAVAYGDRPFLVAAVALGTIAVHDARDPYLHSVADRFFALIFLVAGFVLGIIMRRHLRGADALTLETERLRDVADEQARQAVADERARIARELHDVVAHSVSVMVVQALAARTATEPERLEALGVIETTGRQAMNEMRRLVSVLREGVDLPRQPQPGIPQLEALVGDFKGADMDVTLAVDGDVARVPPGVSLAVYRIVQEALTNALKHAGVTKANVHVLCGALSVDVRVCNTPGPGGVLSRTGAARGLLGMQERVGLYGGTFQAGPTPSGEYVVEASFPLEQL